MKDSVVPLAGVHSCPWQLPVLQAGGRCWEVSQRRVLAFYHSVASLLLQLMQKMLKCVVMIFEVFCIGFVFLIDLNLRYLVLGQEDLR